MFGVEDRFPAPERFSGASDELHELAASLIGSDDFGQDHRLGLRVLLESMDYDPHFSERGRRVASIEGAKRLMPRFARDLNHETIRESQGGSLPKVIQSGCHNLRVLKSQVVVIPIAAAICGAVRL